VVSLLRRNRDFSIFLVTFFRENDDQILSIVNVLLPYQSAHLTQSLRDFIAESTAISGVGLALVIVASVRLIFVVEGVFNAVWGAPRRRMSLRRVALYTFALLALGLVLGGIGWFGFLICVLTLIVLALVALGRSVFRRTAMS